MKKLSLEHFSKITDWKRLPTPAELLRRIADVLEVHGPSVRDERFKGAFEEYCRIARAPADLRRAATKMDLNYEYAKRRKKK